jgi:hypothetical protein
MVDITKTTSSKCEKQEKLTNLLNAKQTNSLRPPLKLHEKKASLEARFQFGVDIHKAKKKDILKSRLAG